jgi:hypothetical protein
MQQKWDGIERRKSLRTEAEVMVARFYPEYNTQQSPEKLMHELLVHKVELELQNEELRLAYAAMQEMRDRYLDLYEISPFGYLTINPKALIAEINLTGADSLGQERKNLLDSNFANLVIAEDQFRWRRLLVDMLASAIGAKQAVELTLKRADKSKSYACLECLRSETTASLAMIRVGLFNIDKLKPAEMIS